MVWEGPKFKVGIAVQRLDSVVRRLRKRAARTRRDLNTSVVVGYTTSYAVYVHEDLVARHAYGTQAKFLEAPAIRMRNDRTLSDIINKKLRSGASLGTALLAAGKKLQIESQKIVPVDTGALRASCFVRVEKGTG